MNILSELRSRFEAALRSIVDDPRPWLSMVRAAQDRRFGDFQANLAMPLAREVKTNPRELAARIVERLEVADLCHEPEVAGPGFINLRLRDEWLAGRTAALVLDERLGVEPAAAARKFVVDYSAPNVAKPMHVGHLRSTVIGDAICRVLGFLGHSVVSDNHVGDWGTQFGMIIFGYKHFLDEEAYRRDMVAELARLYQLVNRLSEYHEAVTAAPKLEAKIAQKRGELEAEENAADPNDKQARKWLKKLRSDLAELEEELAALRAKREAVESDPRLKSLAEAHPDIAGQARRETAKLHAGDAGNRRLWETFLPECLGAIQAMYDRLGIRFDLTLGESYYDPMLPGTVEDLQSRGIARESEGAICVFIEGNEAPFIIRKKDGAFTYATTDLATIRYRVEELKAESVLYVVDARQSEHFRLLFATAAKWGYDHNEFRHVSFGTILGDDRRPFKTRAGGTVGLESLLDEAVARARQIVDANDDAKPAGPELDEAARAQVAEVVGIGGIKYADLRHNRDSDYVFSWEKMLAKTGDTATYIQYAYARIAGIFRKGRIDRAALRQAGGEIRFTAPEERALALQLSRFHDVLDEVVEDYRPNLLTAYLFETADTFSGFYNVCPVLQEEDEATRTSRLLLCDLTARALSQGLELLGIGTSEQM
jgi:arginyl-tRNA synthetase